MAQREHEIPPNEMNIWRPVAHKSANSSIGLTHI